MSSWSQTFTCCQWRLGSSRSAVYSPCVTDVWRAGYRKSSWTFVYLLFIFLQAAVTGGLCFQSSVHQSQYHERSVSRTPTCITSCCSSSCCENSSDRLSLQDLWTCAEVSGSRSFRSRRKLTGYDLFIQLSDGIEIFGRQINILNNPSSAC